MISTATTKLEHPRPRNGGLRDLDPRRRTARLHDADVRIERERPLRHVVHLPDGSTHRRRTFGAAERLGHSFVDRAPHTRRPTAAPATVGQDDRTTPTGLHIYLIG